MPSIFEKYHLKQVINTSGRMTALGVSTPRPEVVEAVMSGMNHYFEIKDLVNKTGEYIAQLLDVEGRPSSPAPRRGSRSRSRRCW